MRLVDVDKLPLFVATTKEAEKMMDRILGAIDKLPTVEMERRGRWIKIRTLKPVESDAWICSSCGEFAREVKGELAKYRGYELTRYCNNCGAKMDEVIE